jgi:nucleotide-binding universal stress UspA family protein
LHGENYLEKILVGFDGSEYSKKALIEAIKIAQKFSAEITIVNVYNDPAGYDLSQRVLEKAKVISEDGEVKFQLVSILSPNTANRIIDVAKKDKVDLIVVGSRGMGALRAHLIGSVATKICHSAPVSVFIVR